MSVSGRPGRKKGAMGWVEAIEKKSKISGT